MKRIGLILGIVLIFSANASALSLSDIRTLIRRNMRDTASDTARRRYSDAVLLEYVNEAQREVLNLTWLTEATTTYGLTSGTTYYDLPNNYLGIKIVEYANSSGQNIELKESSFRKVFQTNPDWDKSTSQPTDYFTQQTDDANFQIAYVGIPPAASTGTVTIRYLNIPADLSGDSDVPFDSKRHLYPYHYSLVYHASARLKLVEGKTDEATVYLQLFNISIGITQDRLGQSPNLFPKVRGISRSETP